ncbi:type V toxin-antitoxin system endoribonuclease antitoxin GhoS [Burkholderia sp. BCC1640]|uniref:type V toxin-antitoxin system endoribonuclease antitoxin GhoS n=1 Tax=Burkholderia sp. BCC1640 TaxID=2676294 RepID=UPI00158F248B|nr:type V toxin-antitoxin system endoribonuclease antitoxin GhoS [Burkholderia sp. BCC1640]
MSSYIARIEVHHATSAEMYKRLHEGLAILGFSRTVFATDGARHHLPTGTYYIETEFDTRTVLGVIQNVASSIGLTGEFVVSHSSDVWFAGLPRA